jgi:D-arabinose 1-dehydrogenase-like Zn-dependent alcohol dehydrogenase
MTMRAVQVSRAGGPLELVQRPLPEPGPGEVRITVQACGVCHSDSVVKDGVFPGQVYPIVPGHEVTGVIDKLGEAVTAWRVGQRVGVGWFGAHDHDITGLTRDGGYAEAMIASAGALAAIPDDLSSVDAAPMLCAGNTVYTALRRCGAAAGDLVAIQGVGGLGHLAIQFAARMGFDVVAIDLGPDREALARQLGARRYVDGRAQDVAEALKRMGRAQVILAVHDNADAMSAAIDGLTPDGRLLVIGVPEAPLAVPSRLLLTGRSIVGSQAGPASASEAAMAFCSLVDVRPMVETMPLECAAQAYDKMLAGAARFRMVLTTGL